MHAARRIDTAELPLGFPDLIPPAPGGDGVSFRPVEHLWQSPRMSQEKPPVHARVRMKLGAHEFEAEGPPELIAAHFATWRELLGAFSQGGDATGTSRPALASERAASELFALDAQRKLVTLRRYPGGRTPDADAVLLLLYGFIHVLGENGRSVAVTRLQRALAGSGRADARIYRNLERYREAGMVRKYGRRRGSSYQLTATGEERAAALVRTLATEPVKAV